MGEPRVKVHTLPSGAGPHQHSQQQRLDLGVRQHLLVQEDVGLRHRHLAEVRVSDSLRFYGNRALSVASCAERQRAAGRCLTYIVVVLSYAPHLGRRGHAGLHLRSLWCFGV